MPPFKLKNPAFIISNNVVYGSMSVVKNYDGYFFVLPRSIDIGWNSNGTDAAEDVTRVIYEVAWQRSLTDGSLHINSSEIKESESNRSMIFLKPYPNVKGWARIYVLTNTSNNVPFYSVSEHRITRKVYGTMEHKSTAARGEGDFTIAFQLAVNFTKPKDANISVAIYDEDMMFIGRQLAQRDIKLSQGQYSFSSNFIVDLNSGRYILKAEDDEGYVYAQSLLYVPPILLTFDAPRPYWDMEPQIIPFKVVLEADPLREGSSPEPLVNRRVYVTVNRSPNVDIFSSPTPLTTDVGGRFNYTPPSGYVFDYGEYTFKVNVSGEILTINAKRTKTAGWFDNPINVVIVVFIIIIVVAGVLLRRPEKPLYTIDVPDFPPLEKVVIPVSKFSVLSLFDSVNKEYKWNFMPLSAQELKNEMRRKITHKGVPILITDYNLDRVLNELIESGDVVKALNLYGLKQWESKGGRSIRYLALFRLLRNFFINNAIPFTDLNERKDCDIFATVKGEGVCTHIYTDENTFRKALKLISAGKNFVIFESKREMDEVVKKLELSYTPTAIILKSEISSGSIMLTQPGSFGMILGR